MILPRLARLSRRSHYRRPESTTPPGPVPVADASGSAVSNPPALTAGLPNLFCMFHAE